MDTQSTTTPEPSNEDLVAYLDGELPADRRAQIEQLLATNETVRVEVQRLQQTWDLLDELPDAEVDDSFTRTTVQMVAASAEEELGEYQRSRRRFGVWFERWWGAGIAGLIGYVLVVLLTPNHNEWLLRHLPVIENFEPYRAVGSMEVLNALEQTGRFSESLANADAEDPQTASPDLDAPRSDQAQQLQQRSPAEQAEIERKFELFRNLDSTQQAGLVELHRELQAAPDRAQKLVVLENFYAWYKELNALERAELGSFRDQPDAMAAQVEKRYAEQSRTRFGLSSSDAQVVLRWMEERTRRRLTPDQRETLSGVDNPDSRRRLMMQMLSESWRDGNRPDALGEQEVAELAAQLSQPARQRLQEEDTLEEKRRVIWGWFAQLRFRSRMPQWRDGRPDIRGGGRGPDRGPGPGGKRPPLGGRPSPQETPRPMPLQDTPSSGSR